MLDFDSAQKKILDAVGGGNFLSRERVSLRVASGRVLAEEVVSPVQLPTNDYSAMDGYAVNTADFQPDSPVELPLLGECRTGHPTVSVERGGCVRIFTGAHIPPGSDAVVMQENTERSGDVVKFMKTPGVGENIRCAGEDLKEGEVVLSAGQRLSGFQLGLLASVERTEVLVARQPRVAILCTGDELRPAGSNWSDGHLAESNSVALAALVESAGGQALVLPLVKDDQKAMEEALAEAKRASDVIVTVGGVSVGDHDVVAPALQSVGAEILFHKVRIKPGKPVLFARWDDTLVLGLPGNPSSAQVTFALFGAPLLRSMQGDRAPVANGRRARLKEAFRQKPGRRGFYRGKLEGDLVEILSNQASGASTAIAWGNCLVVVEHDVEHLASGDEVSVLALNDL